MKQPFFSGVCTALVTPFLDGRINYPMMEVLLRRQINAGISAVVVCGTTGESPTLSDDEKLELFRRCKEFVGNDCKIIAGTGSNSTEHTVSLSKAAQDSGVDGLLVVSPYYNKATPAGLAAHYRTVAQSVDIPIIVYNVPSRTGVDISPTVCKTLSEIPNIAGIKEASTDICKITRIRHLCGGDLPIWSGNDDQTVPVISLGGAGVISVLSNLFPAETQAMAMAAIAGDFDTAAELQTHFLPFTDLLFSEVNPIPVKAAMKYIGYDCGDCRMPLTPLSSHLAEKLKALLV